MWTANELVLFLDFHAMRRVVAVFGFAPCGPHKEPLPRITSLQTSPSIKNISEIWALEDGLVPCNTMHYIWSGKGNRNYDLRVKTIIDTYQLSNTSLIMYSHYACCIPFRFSTALHFMYSHYASFVPLRFSTALLFITSWVQNFKFCRDDWYVGKR